MFLTTISLPLFSGNLANLSAATVLAPDDIPTYEIKSRKDNMNAKDFSFPCACTFIGFKP